MQMVLQHFDLNVHVELPFEEVREALLDAGVQLLTVLDIHLESLALADILS